MSELTSTRRIAVVLLAAASGAVGVSGCFGSAHDGTDSETHFACASNADCASRGTGFECLRGVCLRREMALAPVIRSEAGVRSVVVPEAGTDAGVKTFPPSVAPRDAGAEASAPAGAPEGGSPVVDAGPSKGLLPPFTMDVRVTGAPGEVLPSNLRVALVWYPGEYTGWVTGPDAAVSCAPRASGGHLGTVVQPATMHDLGAGRFTLDVTELPPHDAFMLPGSPLGFPWAGGQVVAYEDGNANAALDFATPASASSDEIVGVSAPDLSPLLAEYGFTNYILKYSEEEVSNLDQIEIPMPRGFSIYLADNSSVSTFHDSSELVTRPIAITLRRVPTVRALICTDLCRDGSFDEIHPPAAGCPATPLGLPKMGSGLCEQSWPDQPPTSFVWRHVICSACECRLEQCGYSPYTNGVPTPDWPCGAVASRTEYPEP